MFCQKCGNQLPRDSRFCHKCGTKVAETANTSKNSGAPRGGHAMQDSNTVQQRSVARSKGQIIKTAGSASTVLIIIVLIIVFFKSCGNSNTIQSQNNNSNTTITTSSEGILNSSSNNRHYLSIKNYSISEDHKTLFGEEYIEFIVYYEWTNNGTSATSAASALPEIRVYQDGFECSSRGYGEDNFHRNIRPGDTLGFYLNYELFDASSDVVVEVDDNPHISKRFVIRPGAGDSAGQSTSGESGTSNQSTQWKVAYANKVRELAAQDNELQFALIDLTGSDIPALVSDHSSYYGSVFIWADGALFTVMEGIRGSCYLPGGNVICVWDKLQAGAIVYESYMTVNDAYEVVDIYDESLSSWYFKDINGDGIMDENEPVSEEPYYYYGNTEITAEEYSSYQIPGDYEWIAGDKSVEEIISQLNGENVTDSISVSEVLYKGIPVIPLLETSIDDIMALLGKPTDEGQYLQGYFYDYNNEILFILDADKRNIIWIEISPEALTAGGVSLDKDRAFLVKTFGEPTKEYIDEMTREYTISYNIKKYTLAFILADSSSKVSKVTIHFNGQ